MPQFFIDRPIFAWVLAILVTLGGIVAIARLAAEAYRAIAPPQVIVSALYPGANASTVEATVTQVIEQQLTGLDNLLYFTSQSSSDGSCQITLTFDTGTSADIAAVQTQNRVTLAVPRLPSEVNAQGIRIAKASAGFLAAVALRSSAGGPSAAELNNIVASQVLDQIQRLPGVGSATQFGSEYAMRIWLDPDKLHAFAMSAAAVLSTVRAQNVQVASGAIGAEPALPGQQLNASVMAEGRFTSPQQFENILLRTNPNGTAVRLKDVAHVELGQSQYGSETRVGGTPVAAFGIQLLPNANALEVIKAVTARMAELQSSFPAGVTWFIPYDSSTFINVAIREVIITLVEAVALVFVVMLVFLQSLRATLIPTLVVPAALLGALIGMYAVGFSINQLSLFAMVLAIGIVVDDAIVVVEAVERIMRPEHLTANFMFRWFNRAYERTRRSYVRRVFQSVTHASRWMAAFAVMLVIGAFLFLKLPGSFLPEEDQGYALVDVQLPPGSSLQRTREVLTQVDTVLKENPAVEYVFLVAGSSFTGQSENVGRAFVHLKLWEIGRASCRERV